MAILVRYVHTTRCNTFCSKVKKKFFFIITLNLGTPGSEDPDLILSGL
jgi:hypothetical protein